MKLEIENVWQLIESTRQPCRMEKIANRSDTVILDVCHNIDGFKAVLNEVRATYPECTSISLVFGISKSKKLDNLVKYLEDEPLVKDVYLVSRPHMRLYKVEDAFKIVK